VLTVFTLEIKRFTTIRLWYNSGMKYYTYKITFKDLPGYFYYGSHKDNGKPYFGSPKTWRRLWEVFEAEIQVLQWYETEKEARRAEKLIINATWEDKYSLNEHNGYSFSEEACSRGAKNQPVEVRVDNGKKYGKKNGPANGKKGRDKISKRLLLTDITTGDAFEFPSARAAARVLDLDASSLSKVARGERKQHKGYAAVYPLGGEAGV